MNPHPQSTGSYPGTMPCPVCGGSTELRKCKEVCRRCGALVQNCSGD